MHTDKVVTYNSLHLNAIVESDRCRNRHNSRCFRELLRCLDVQVDKGDIAVLLLELLKLGLEQLAGITPGSAKLDNNTWCAVDELMNVVVVSDDHCFS